jgi:hypothetical protein
MGQRIKPREIFIVGFDRGSSNTLTQYMGKLKTNIHPNCYWDAEEALAAMHSRQSGDQPSLVFLNASCMDSFLWKVKAHRLTRQVPVLILAHHLSQQELERGYQLGANSIIELPKPLPALTETLETTLSYWLDFCQLTHGLSPLMMGNEG